MSSMPRMLAIDLARFIALIGMMAAHLLAPFLETAWLETITSGFPSTLFAVLGGFGVVFTTRRYLEAHQRTAATVAVATRGLVVAGIGVVMEAFPDHSIAVILVYYGVTLVVGSFLILLPPLPLAILLSTLAIAGPLALPKIRQATQGWVSEGTLDYSSPHTLILSLFFTGIYPVVTWTVYLGVGIAVARIFIHASTPGQRITSAAIAAGIGATAVVLSEVVTRIRLAHIVPTLAQWNNTTDTAITQFFRENAIGAPFSGGWNALLIATPHSGTTADIARTGGGAIVLISFLTILCAYVVTVPVWLRPFATLGSIPLTAYTLHIAMTAYSLFFYLRSLGLEGTWVPEYTRPFLATAFWWQLGILFVLALCLTIAGKRGPLEALTSYISRKATALVLPSPPLIR